MNIQGALKKIRRSIPRKIHTFMWETVVSENLLPVFNKIPHSRAQTPSLDSLEKILVWCIDSPGDSLWITPTLRALRSGCPKAEISLVCSQSTKEIFETNPHISNLIPIDPTPFYTGAGLFYANEAIAKIENSKFDLFLILEMGSRPADRARLLASKCSRYTVSTNLGLLKTYPDFTLPPNQGGSAIYWPDYYLQTTQHLGIPFKNNQLEIYPNEQDQSLVNRIKKEWIDFPEKKISIHPLVAPYARLTKMWPLENYIELASLLLKNHDVHILLTGSKDEAPECERIAQAVRDRSGSLAIHSIAGRMGFRPLYVLLQEFELLVTGDTSILHLGAAAKIKTVALFGATNWNVIAPPAAKVIAKNLSCQPCHSYNDRRPFWPKCVFDTPKCLESISVEEVYKTILQSGELK